MKRVFSTLVVVALVAVLLISGVIAASGGVTFDLSVDGSHQVWASTGDTVTVTFAVTGKDAVTLSTLQNEIYYDTDFFELIRCEAAEGSGATVAEQQRVNGDHVVLVTYWGSKAITDSTEFAVLELKVKAGSGSSTVESKTRRDLAVGESGSGVEAYLEADGSPVDITVQSVTVTVGTEPTTPPTPTTPPAPSEPPTPSDPVITDVYDITVEETEHGTVGVSTSRSPAGSTVTVTPVPDLFYGVGSLTVTEQSGKSVPAVDNGDGTYSFVMPASPVTVKVSFIHTYCPSEPYVDVIKSEWYHPAVDYVIYNKYFIGTSATTFEPNTVMTRAMFVTVIARMEGIDESAYTGGGVFYDVPDGQWYTATVAWGAENGIVLGYGDGNFGPDDIITREQMAAMLYRYTNYTKTSLPKTGVSLDTFPDSTDVSGWAREAMEWATQSDLLHGTDTGLVEPLRGATRAEMAQLLMNYDLARK